MAAKKKAPKTKKPKLSKLQKAGARMAARWQCGTAAAARDREENPTEKNSGIKIVRFIPGNQFENRPDVWLGTDYIAGEFMPFRVEGRAPGLHENWKKDVSLRQINGPATRKNAHIAAVRKHGRRDANPLPDPANLIASAAITGVTRFVVGRVLGENDNAQNTVDREENPVSAKKPKKDSRYTVRPARDDAGNPQYVVRFLDEWVGTVPTKKEAEALTLAHKAWRDEWLTTDAAAGWKTRPGGKVMSPWEPVKKAKKPRAKNPAKIASRASGNPMYVVLKAYEAFSGKAGWWTGEGWDTDRKKARKISAVAGLQNALQIAKQLANQMPNNWHVEVHPAGK